MRVSRYRSMALVAGMLLAVACASVPPVRSLPNAEGEVRVAMASFMEALNALDAERMATHFTDDVTAFVPAAQAGRVDGHAAVTRIFRNFVVRTKAVTPALQLVPEDMRVEVSGDLGVVTFTIREGEQRVTRRRTFLFRRTNDRWLISHFHASDVTAAQ